LLSCQKLRFILSRIEPPKSLLPRVVTMEIKPPSVLPKRALRGDWMTAMVSTMSRMVVVSFM
jgi:hypothetical protein